MDNITILLAGIFSIADEIGVDVDKAEAFDVANDLRRTVGSWLAQDGQSLHLIGDVLNRRDPKTTAGYAQSSVVAPPFLFRAVATGSGRRSASRSDQTRWVRRPRGYRSY